MNHILLTNDQTDSLKAALRIAMMHYEDEAVKARAEGMLIKEEYLRLECKELWTILGVIA